MALNANSYQVIMHVDTGIDDSYQTVGRSHRKIPDLSPRVISSDCHIGIEEDQADTNKFVLDSRRSISAGQA